ncbi:MAG: hypothetical protein JST76_01545, partial [Bacteroidetes bacterium]|nr:hypothetical protein [Bacteroidota bacterium]
YIGVDNPIRIETSGLPKSELSVKWRVDRGEPPSGVIYKDSITGTYIAVPKAPVFAFLDIYYHDTLLSSEQYRCKSVPTPRATIGSKYNGGTVTVKNLIDNVGLIPVLDNFDFACRISVVSYSMTYTSGGTKKTVFANGPVYSAEMKSLITNAKPDDVLLFQDIIVRYSDGSTVVLAPIAFIIV